MTKRKRGEGGDDIREQWITLVALLGMVALAIAATILAR